MAIDFIKIVFECVTHFITKTQQRLKREFTHSDSHLEIFQQNQGCIQSRLADNSGSVYIAEL